MTTFQRLLDAGVPRLEALDYIAGVEHTPQIAEPLAEPVQETPPSTPEVIDVGDSLTVIPTPSKVVAYKNMASAAAEVLQDPQSNPVKALRAAMGLSQWDFCRKLRGIGSGSCSPSAGMISQWENGRTRPIPFYRRRLIVLAQEVAESNPELFGHFTELTF